MPREQVKASAVKVNLGTGCLFQPPSERFTYVLTARHCLLDHTLTPPYARIPLTAITVNAYSDAGVAIPLVVLDYFVSQVATQDIAVILVERVENYRPLSGCDYPVWGEEGLAFGYPAYRATADHPVDYLTCSLRLADAHRGAFDVDTQSTLFSFNRSGIENAKGFSGAGVYVTRGEQSLLVGILAEVKNPDGIFDRLVAFGIDLYNQLLAASTYEQVIPPPLVPAYLASFATHLGQAFQYDNHRLEVLLRETSASIITKGIHPFSILEKFRNKLFLPHSGDTSLANDQLWQGWLELLTFLSFEDETFNSLKDITWKNRYFFYTGAKSWSNVVKYIHVDLAGNFKPGSKFILNNGASPPEPSKPNAKLIARILPNIASGNAMVDVAGKMNIAEAQIPAQFMFVHLQEFKKAFVLAEEELSTITNKSELKAKIQSLLNSVFSHD